MRGRGLADRADVVALAFDREQHRALDRPRLDRLALPFELAERQRTFLEDQAHGLQIEFRGEVEHGEIFVVERLRDLRLLVLALGEIVVELAMRLHMALDVHAHEGGELHEARIDPAERARIAQRHGGDQIALEPFDRLRIGELVHLGRIDAGVDRPRHQGHAARLRGIAGLRHHRGGDEHGDAGLAHRHHMGARPDRLQEADQVLDIFVEAEPAVRSAARRAHCASR